MPFKPSEVSICIFLFAVLAAIGYYLNPSNIGFYGVSPHPYILLCLLLSGLFGLKAAIFSSTILSSLYFLFLYYHVDHRDVVSIFSTPYIFLPIAMTLISVLLGEYSDSLYINIKKKESVIKEKDELHNQQKKILSFKERENAELQKKITSQMSTITTHYESAKGLSSYELSELYQNFVDLLQEFLHIESCVLYLKKKDSYQMEIWTPDVVPDPPLDNTISLDQKPEDDSIRTLPSRFKEETITDPLILSCISQNRLVHLHDIQSIGEADIHKGNSILVGPINDEDAKIIGVMVVYAMPFLSYVPSNFKLFSLLLEWVTASHHKALEYHAMKKKTTIDQQLGIYSAQYGQERFLEEFDRAKTHMLPLTIIAYEFKNYLQASPTRRQVILKTLARVIGQDTRKIDAICVTPLDGIWITISPLQRPDETEDIISRIEKDLSILSLEVNPAGVVLNVDIHVATFDAEMTHPAELWEKLEIGSYPYNQDNAEMSG